MRFSSEEKQLCDDDSSTRSVQGRVDRFLCTGGGGQVYASEGGAGAYLALVGQGKVSFSVFKKLAWTACERIWHTKK